MTFPTVAVTVRLAQLTGVTSVVGETVTATLDKDDRYGGFLVASSVSGVVDASGNVVLQCFPNHPTTGLGTTGSTYTFACKALSFRCTAQVPNAACELHDIADLATVPSLSLAEAAEAAAVLSAAAASGSAAAALVSEGAAADSAAAALVSAASAAFNDTNAIASVATVTPVAADTVVGVQGGAVKRFAVSGLPVAAGASNELQFNAGSGVMGATTGVTWDSTARALKFPGTAATGLSPGNGGIIVGTLSAPAGIISLRHTITGDFMIGAVYGYHGFEDYSTINMTGATNAYAAFASSPSIIGSSNYNHAKAMQAWPYFSGSGTMDSFYGIDSYLSHTGTGLITNMYGLRIWPSAGSGPVTNEYGIFIEHSQRGTALNYAIWAAAGKNYFGGPLGVGPGTNAVASGLMVGGGNISMLTAGKYFVQESTQSKFGDASGIFTGGAGTDTGISCYSAGVLIFGSGSTPLMTLGASGQLTPAGDSTQTLGDATHHWSTGYFGSVVTVTAAPATAVSTGTLGEIRSDTGYVYVCTAANTWKRAAITTW